MTPRINLNGPFVLVREQIRHSGTGALAVLEAKSTIYCLDKGQAKRKSSELCSKMDENDFINMLNKKSDNTNSIGKFTMY